MKSLTREWAEKTEGDFDDLAEVRKIVLDGLVGYSAKVYLFGSQATGTAKSTSDIDIAIWPLGPVPEQVFANISQALEESAVLRPVELVDTLTADDALRERVLREGILWRE